MGFTSQETRTCQEEKGETRQTSSLRQRSHSPCSLTLKVYFRSQDQSLLDQFLCFLSKILLGDKLILSPGLPSALPSLGRASLSGPPPAKDTPDRSPSCLLGEGEGRTRKAGLWLLPFPHCRTLGTFSF